MDAVNKLMSMYSEYPRGLIKERNSSITFAMLRKLARLHG